MFHLLSAVTANGSLSLDEKHPYYHQIQGQLYVMNKMCCDLIVWTTKDTAVIRIARDLDWLPNLSKLKEFYIGTYIPHIFS